MPSKTSTTSKAKAKAAPKADATTAKDKKSTAKVADKPVNGDARSPFVKKQHQKLLDLRDSMLDAMSGVAKDNLRSRAEGNEASAFGMHQADAGSDAYDRDFALSLLSQEQDDLYEIQEALKRIDAGTYGVCEISGEKIPHPRLEAVPFARYTVQCQTQIEKENNFSRVRRPVTSLFGLSDESDNSSDDDLKD